ncbi:MAG: UDP-N-acetylmuramoyl-tripeptide--D-alanyl-D-alanine ligase, partial [Oscillospiraceae bacterium]|nr:UDP-N-acetylmuramoyl-tripeptide--D-alanyl-D-alanine ligase [Oscillospiraceae bacterium]
MSSKIMRVSDIIRITGGKLVSGSEETVLYGFTKDTRDIKENDMYLGIKGESFDGNDYVGAAFEAGALGVVVDKLPSEDVLEKYVDKIIVQVQDTVKAMQEMAKYKRSLYDVPVVAITGSVGKTSTKDMMASVLSKKYNVLKTQGNYNNHIGLPLTLLNLKEEHTAMVLEMGMNHMGEISVLTAMGRPTICIYTTIGTAHIGNLGSRENILKAKLEMLEGITGQSAVVINNDNDLLSAWRETDPGYDITTYG